MSVCWSLGPRGDEVKALASGHGRGKGQTEEEHRVQYDMCDTRVLVVLEP